MYILTMERSKEIQTRLILNKNVNIFARRKLIFWTNYNNTDIISKGGKRNPTIKRRSREMAKEVIEEVNKLENLKEIDFRQ